MNQILYSEKILPIYIVFFALFIYHSNLISNTILGTVLDKKTKIPLENVHFEIKESKISTFSDSNGQFIINVAKMAEINISAIMVGYKPQEIKISFQKDSVVQLLFLLESFELAIDSVLVIGNRIRNVMANPSSESAALDAASSLVNRQQIEQQGAGTVIEAMKFVPGALVETRGRKVRQFFSVRGQRYPYPGYAINGTWQREFHEIPYFWSPVNIERIEIIRSSAVFLSGVPDMAGLINIIPRRYNQSENIVELGYGTFGSFQANFSHGNKINNFSYASGIGYTSTNGPEGRYSTEKMVNVFGNLNWQLFSSLKLNLDIFYLNGSRQLTQAVPPAASKFQTALWKYDPYISTIVNLKTIYRPNPKVSTELQICYANRDPKFIVEDENTHKESRFSEKDYEYSFNLIQAITPLKNNIIRFAMNHNRWMAPNGKRFYTGRRNDLGTFSAVVVDEHQFNRLYLEGGFRLSRTFLYEYAAFNIDGSSMGFTNVEAIRNEWEPSILQGKFGLAYYFLKNFSVNLHLAQGKIKPRSGTLNVNLETPKNENRFQFDVGMKGEWRKFGELLVAGFYTNQKNAIALSGITYSIDERIQELYLNRDQYQIGMELGIHFLQFKPLAEAFFNLTYLKSFNRSNNHWFHLKEIPNIIFNSGISAIQKGFNISLFARYVSSYESTRFAAGNPPQNQKLGNYLEWDFTFSHALDCFTGLTLYLEIKNLTDQYYSTVVGYPDFGRIVRIGLRKLF